MDFTIASDEFGEAKVIELKPDGRNISVDKDNVIEYIHLVSDYKINRSVKNIILIVALTTQLCKLIQAIKAFFVTMLSGKSWKNVTGSERVCMM